MYDDEVIVSRISGHEDLPWDLGMSAHFVHGKIGGALKGLAGVALPIAGGIVGGPLGAAAGSAIGGLFAGGSGQAAQNQQLQALQQRSAADQAARAPLRNVFTQGIQNAGNISAPDLTGRLGGIGAGQFSSSDQTRGLEGQAIGAVGQALGAPGIGAAAQGRLQNIFEQSADQRKIGSRDIGRSAAAFGRVGSGVVNTQLGDLEARIQRGQQQAFRGLAGDTATAEAQDRLARAGLGLGAAGQFQGRDLRTAGFQQGQEQQRFQNRNQVFSQEQGALGQQQNFELERLRQAGQIGFGGAPGGIGFGDLGVLGNLTDTQNQNIQQQQDLAAGIGDFFGGGQQQQQSGVPSFDPNFTGGGFNPPQNLFGGQQFGQFGTPNIVAPNTRRNIIR